MVEQCAQPFTHCARVPVLRTPEDVGLNLEECQFDQQMGWRPGSFGGTVNTP